MRVAIAGAHGQIARLLTQQLAAEGHGVVGLVRSTEHFDDVRTDGAEPILCDLEEATTDEVATAIAHTDALVFAAGAGPGSGAARKETVDYGAAVRCLQAMQAAGVDRYVMVSAMGVAVAAGPRPSGAEGGRHGAEAADHPPGGDDVFAVYLRAKARADEAVMDSDRDWTIVRPGRLTDDSGTGTVTLARHVGRAQVPRADVAAVLAAVLTTPATVGHVFEVVGGDTPIADALAALTAT